MDQEGAVGLEHEEPNGLRQSCRQTTRVQNLAAGDEKAHGRWTVLSFSDMQGTIRPIPAIYDLLR